MLSILLFVPETPWYTDSLTFTLFSRIINYTLLESEERDLGDELASSHFVIEESEADAEAETEGEPGPPESYLMDSSTR